MASAATGRGSLFQVWARQQRVRRPFEALIRMGHESREAIAEQLGIDLQDAWGQAVANCNFDLGRSEEPAKFKSRAAEAEAAIIIGMDGYGFQARSHSTFRTLDPTERNHTWREILLSVVDEFEMPVRKKAGTPNVEELESAVFEWVANKALKDLSSAEKAEIEKFLESQPEFVAKVKVAGFGPMGSRLLVKGVFKAAARGGFGTYINAVKAAAFLNRKIGTKLVMSSVTGGLKTVLRGTNVILWAWIVKDVLDLLFGSSRARLIQPISEIHQFYLLEALDAE